MSQAIIDAVMRAVWAETRDNFDEEQHPRDEHGKFAAGSGDLIQGKTEEEWQAEYDKNVAEQKSREDANQERNVPLIKAAMQEQCFKLGVTPDRVTFSNQDRQFAVGDRVFNEGGHANVYGDKTLEFKDSMIIAAARQDDSEKAENATKQMQGIVIHEVEHLKYQAVMDAYQKQAQEFYQEAKAVGDRLEAQGMSAIDAYRDPSNPMRGSGELKPAFYDKYPLVATFDTTFGTYGYAHTSYDKDGNAIYKTNGDSKVDDNAAKLKASDGCTPYSKAYWQSEALGKAYGYQSAMHEAVAETARLRETDKEAYKTNVAMIWRNYVRDVDRFAKKIRF